MSRLLQETHCTPESINSLESSVAMFASLTTTPGIRIDSLIVVHDRQGNLMITLKMGMSGEAYLRDLKMLAGVPPKGNCTIDLSFVTVADDPQTTAERDKAIARGIARIRDQHQCKVTILNEKAGITEQLARLGLTKSPGSFGKRS